MSSVRRNASMKDLNELKQTIADKMKNYQQNIAKLDSLPELGYPDGKICNTQSFTTNIDSCVAVIIFNEEKPYLFGHFPSLTYSDGSKTVELFKDVMPVLLTEFKEMALNPSSLKALVVGGNTKLFEDIVKFLKESHIKIVGTYLDKFDIDNYVEKSLYNKTLEFNPATKEGRIYSPLLKEGTQIINGKNIRPYEDTENTLFLRSESYNYLTKQGVQTGFVSDNKKSSGGLFSRSCTLSILEKGKFAPPQPQSPLYDEPLTGVLSEDEREDDKALTKTISKYDSFQY